MARADGRARAASPDLRGLGRNYLGNPVTRRLSRALDQDAGSGVFAQRWGALDVVGVRMGEHDSAQLGRVVAQLGDCVH
jgi:hypothetical protein